MLLLKEIGNINQNVVYSRPHTHKAFVIHVSFIFKCLPSFPSSCWAILRLLRPLLWWWADAAWRPFVTGKSLRHVPVQHILLFWETESSTLKIKLQCTVEILQIVVKPKKNSGREKIPLNVVVTFSQLSIIVSSYSNKRLNKWTINLEGILCKKFIFSDDQFLKNWRS